MAAILSADAVGFSRQMHRDEAGTHARLQSCREIIDLLVAEHDGRIVGSAGDSVLADFPSVVEALTCAVDIQQALREHNTALPPELKLEFRIGINLGDVIIHGEDIYGDGVNVAARLQQLAEPGGILVSRTVHNHVRGKLDLTFESLGEHQVKNIPEPVAVFRVCLDGSRASALKPSKRTPMRAKRVWLATTILLLFVGAAVALWFARGILLEEHLEERAKVADPVVAIAPVVAILPFANQSGDPGQDYFSDGITEDLIAALGRFSNLRVISRGTTFAYKGQTVDPMRIGRELGARYLIEGSARKSDDRIRVSIQLADARGGLLLWSERYEQGVADVFTMQDAIVQRLVGTIAVKMTRVEQERALAKAPADLAAYDYVLRGRQQLARRTRAANAEARELFRRATELDPRYTAAQVGLGYTYMDAALFGWTNGRRARSRAPKNWRRKPSILMMTKQAATPYLAWCMKTSSAGTSPRPSSTGLSSSTPATLRFVPCVELSMLTEAASTRRSANSRLSSRSIRSAIPLGQTWARPTTSRVALGMQSKSWSGISSRKPDRVMEWAILAAAYAELGLEPQARDAAAKVLKLSPFFATEDLISALYKVPSQRERLAADLHSAGLP